MFVTQLHTLQPTQTECTCHIANDWRALKECVMSCVTQTRVAEMNFPRDEVSQYHLGMAEVRASFGYFIKLPWLSQIPKHHY